MLNRKPLIIAAVAAATLGVATLSSQAYAHDDALLGAIVGAVLLRLGELLRRAGDRLRTCTRLLRRRARVLPAGDGLLFASTG